MLFRYSVAQVFIFDCCANTVKVFVASDANVYVDRNRVIFCKYFLHQ